MGEGEIAWSYSGGPWGFKIKVAALQGLKVDQKGIFQKSGEMGRSEGVVLGDPGGGSDEVVFSSPIMGPSDHLFYSGGSVLCRVPSNICGHNDDICRTWRCLS